MTCVIAWAEQFSYGYLYGCVCFGFACFGVWLLGWLLLCCLAIVVGFTCLIGWWLLVSSFAVVFGLAGLLVCVCLLRRVLLV